MLRCAVDAFAEQGYHATTTRDIANRAGLSPAALYVHYPSKAALLATISRIGHEAALALVEQAAGPADDPRDPRERLRAVAASITAWHARHHRVARVVQYELSAVPPEDRADVVRMRRLVELRVESVIAEGVAAGVMTAGAHRTPRALARAVLSLAIDVARWYDPEGHDSPEDLGRLYADLAARMVGALDQER
jgi:AcrR family transcriptional regulator